MRKVFWLLTAITLTLFASFAFADDGGGNKTYQFTPAPAPTIAPGVTSNFVVSIKNTSGSDDSGTAFKSLILTAPAGVMITSVSGATVTTPLPAHAISVINVTTKPNKTLQLTLGLSANCGGGGPWSASVYTGNPPPNGSLFTNPAFPSTNVASCTLSFGTQPTNALVGAKITGSKYNPAGSPVTVQLTAGGNPVNSTVTLTASCTSGSVGTVSQASFNGLAAFDNLVAGAAAASGCTLTATALNNFTPATSSPTFNVSKGTLSFALPPANTLSGAVITSTPFNNPKGSSVAVQLLLDGIPTADPAFDNTVVTITDPNVCVGSGSTAKVTSGLATFGPPTALTAVSIAAGGQDRNCTVGASAPNFNNPPLAAASFTVKAPSGAAACGQTSLIVDGNPSSASTPGHVDASRGLNDKDAPCTQQTTGVPYSLTTSTDTVTGAVTVKLIWDTTGTGKPNAAFSYTVTSSPVDVPANGWPAPRQPRVAWNVTSTGDPVFINAQACAAPILPKQYGTGSIGGPNPPNPAPTSLALAAPVDPATLPSTPFPIVIGSERMLVTTVVSNMTWTVQRGDGGTQVSDHSQPAPVMSTPLPLLTSDAVGSQAGLYPVGTPAHMCIWDQSWMSMGFKSGTTPGVPQAVYSTSVFDIGDGVFSDE